jgi:FlaA1/EpsC-like NDP-sugar epimerase
MDRFRSAHARVLAWPRGAKRALMLVVDGLAMPVLLYLAHAIRVGDLAWSFTNPWLLLAAPLITLPILYFAGFYRAIVRYLGSEMVWGVAWGMAISAGLLAGFAYMLPDAGTPRSVFIIYLLLGILYLGGSRFLVRRYLFWAVGGLRAQQPVAIFGAGMCGAQLASALGAGTEYRPVLFVDDKASLQRTTLAGIPITDRKGLMESIPRLNIKRVLLAIPSASRKQRRNIVSFLEQLEVGVMSVPGFPDIVSGRARIEELREVAIEDLLGRDPVPPDEALLRPRIEGRSVLVTGAGGSIGSELCRQIARLAPRRLILVDHTEFALYSIERELEPLAERGGGIELVPLLGTVVDGSFMETVCSRYEVETLYHAAAYKHVPMVESSPAAGVRNNIFGTLNTARAAERAGVSDFILVSTDKAVRPTNIMGATKRFAEILLQDMHNRKCATRFSMVRFGNVLGSSGSVVPLFRRQVREGGPITVTHPDVVRYFMTIPEAAQLVLQAGGMARGGEVFVLDIGEPVRIYDLACTLAHLMGSSVKNEHNPDGDIEIVFTGLRPGEKLYEELLIGEASEGTDHPMIMRAQEECPGSRELDGAVNAILAAQVSDDRIAIVEILKRIVCGYHPAPLALEEGRAMPGRNLH